MDTVDDPKGHGGADAVRTYRFTDAHLTRFKIAQPKENNGIQKEVEKYFLAASNPKL